MGTPLNPATVAHQVDTEHGSVIVHGRDVNHYRTVDEWVRDHNPLIANALAAAGLAMSVASFYVSHVKRAAP